MEEYINESVVARIFLGCQHDSTAKLRDHASIARAEAALSAEGIEEINKLIVKQAVRLGFGDPSLLSGDTTAQELPIGYPNEVGILKRKIESLRLAGQRSFVSLNLNRMMKEMMAVGRKEKLAER